MATGCVRRDLLIFLTLFVLLTSSDVLWTSVKEPDVPPCFFRYFYIGKSVSTPTFESFSASTKNQVAGKMVPISRTKQLSSLLRLAKYGLIAKLNVSLYLLLCGTSHQILDPLQRIQPTLISLTKVFASVNGTLTILQRPSTKK